MLKGEKWYKVFLAAKDFDRRVPTPPEPDLYCAIPKRTWNEVRCRCPLWCLYMHMSDHPLHDMCSYQQHVYDTATPTRVGNKVVFQWKFDTKDLIEKTVKKWLEEPSSRQTLFVAASQPGEPTHALLE